jgi:hypothetical protein
MNSTLFVPILATGFAVAFLHTIIPTHWLPFALVGRAQGWSRRKTLAVAAFAALGHTFTTLVLGALLTGMGLWIEHRFGRLSLYIGGLLILVGLFHLVRYIRMLRGGVADEESRAVKKVRGVYGSDVAAIAALFSIVALSPGETFLSVYLAAIRFGWAGFALLSLVLGLATMMGMVLFTAISFWGAQRLPLRALERNEAGVMAGVLCALGVAVMVWPG